MGCERKTKDLDNMQCIKDEDDIVYVQERNIKDKWNDEDEDDRLG